MKCMKLTQPQWLSRVKHAKMLKSLFISFAEEPTVSSYVETRDLKPTHSMLLYSHYRFHMFLH